MAYPLAGRKILIISPQQWGDMMVSKHHYAVELAGRGNQVCFLNPAAPELPRRLMVERHPQLENLSIVSHRPYFNRDLRFHLRPLYDLLMRIDTRLLRRSLRRSFDVVWCFDPNSYSSLADFGASRIIYQLVDQFTEPAAHGPAREADLIISVAKEILDRFDAVPRPKLLVNHGVATSFVDRAKARLAARDFKPKAGERVRVGYAGNLLLPRLDVATLGQIIVESPDVDFHIWGNHDPPSSFVAELRRRPNVTLYGPVSADKLAAEIQSMDAFLVCYEWWKDLNGGANTHKVLEYLSTGKVVVASRISSYLDSSLIQMSTREGNTDLVEIFRTTITRLDGLNRAELQEKRISLALENSYARHIDAIELALDARTDT